MKFTISEMLGCVTVLAIVFAFWPRATHEPPAPQSEQDSISRRPVTARNLEITTGRAKEKPNQAALDRAIERYRELRKANE